MDPQTIITLLIVAAATLYTALRAYRFFTGSTKGACHCPEEDCAAQPPKSTDNLGTRIEP